MLEEPKLQGFHKWLDTRWKLIVCDVEFPGFLQNFNQKKESPGMTWLLVNMLFKHVNPSWSILFLIKFFSKMCY